jgi:malonate-semialdehyde dehydrogenase (acetylating)/methylmalonate-semialdehyde dehydrogenase
MIPLWMFPLSITLGNTYILKPSEKVAGTAEILIDLLKEAGVPDGVVNVVQGGPQTVTAICEHEDIRAVSFVGGNDAGEYIYSTASKYGKRAQVNMGAKNHAVVMPDADKEDTINAIIGACFGSTGQRCMAITTTVFVGESADWIPEIVERTKGLSVGPGWENADIGPMNNKAALARAERLIDPANNVGAKMLMDGRKPHVEGYPNGNWIGPTMYDNVEPGHAVYDEELFAPVFVAVRRETLSEAIEFLNEN